MVRGNGRWLDRNHADGLIVFLAAVGRPKGVLFRPREVKEMEEEDEGDEKRKAKTMDVTKEHLISLYHQLTIKLLTLVGSLLPTCPTLQSVSTLIATFTDPLDPWTTPMSHKLSQLLLPHILNPKQNTPSNSMERILTDTVRPLFAPYTKQTTRTHHLAPSLTRTAMAPSFTRKAPDPKLHISDTPIPWIDDRPETTTLLNFVLSTASNSSAAELIPLILPPLLTLLDYPAHIHTTKPTALRLLGKFAKTLPRDYLLPPPRGRGLGEVIWDAVLPYLHWLPPLTPQEASVRILKEAFLALVGVVEGMYPTFSSHEHQRQRESGRERQKKLDRIMREGIKNAVAYCPENVAVMGVVLFALEPDQEDVSELGVIRAMGIGTVKHLDFLVPWLCGILSNPFSVLQVGVLVSGAVRVLRAILVQGGVWVRIRYPGEDKDELGGLGVGREGLQWELLGGCIDAWRALNDRIDSLDLSTSNSSARKIIDVTEEQGWKRSEIGRVMNELVGLVGVLEGIYVYTDPKSGEEVGKAEWEGVVKGLLEVEEEGEVGGWCEGGEDESRRRKRRETRRLLGAQVDDEFGKSGDGDRDISAVSKRPLRELFGR
ncbi:hypothetical protein L211DRAFT_868192 [Terfezia boudieri ATCC MYA-4762]|uniref:Pre-rRNA-processing protein RIX1 n=1 Tax=Terfezia boudieri ATCC MYA-4762 TaxID=1051890 RepID=A0A3N4M181_9PEZI|nr:hypothetical protein L211DRAFT_868192 [Terfezia boudieri ATCC MYA-4762]